MRTLGFVVLMLSGCAHRVSPAPDLSIDRLSTLFPASVQDKSGWARALELALRTNRLPVDLEHACSVIAIAEQESGITEDPTVANLPAITRKALEEKASKLGPPGRLVLERLLESKDPSTGKTFQQRLERLKTESDLDRLFRDLLEAQERERPLLTGLADLGTRLFGDGALSELNPVTTAGSMQVSVRFARAHAKTLRRDERLVRDELYTREGGLLYGSARLWSFTASYDSMRFRFADYNAGAFSSRNAAFQEQLSRLTGLPLVLDGDLLAYDADGDVKSTQTQSMHALEQLPGRLDVVADARAEKRADFERTETWNAVKHQFETTFGKRPAYARLPTVELHSVKLSKGRTTAWFAEAVFERYRRCLAR